jgi:hypothetical protein
LKTKLFALLAAVGVLIGVAASPVYATDVDYWSGAATLPAPVYGTYLYDGVMHVNSPAWASTFDVTAAAGADYGAHPTTWRYPTPGIPANWLRVSVTLQGSNTGSGAAQGNCSAQSSGYHYNTAGHYSVSVTDSFVLFNCKDPNGLSWAYIRPWVRIAWNPGGLGWVEHIYWYNYPNGDGWIYNPAYPCDHGGC